MLRKKWYTFSEEKLSKRQVINYTIIGGKRMNNKWQENEKKLQKHIFIPITITLLPLSI